MWLLRVKNKLYLMQSKTNKYVDVIDLNFETMAHINQLKNWLDMAEAPGSIKVGTIDPDPYVPPEKEGIWFTQDAVNLIKKWEGYHKELPDGSAEAYQGAADAPGKFSIGWGSTFDYELMRTVQRGDVWTKAKCERMLLNYIEKAARDVLFECGEQCTQSMFDALVSFTYSLGLEGNNKQTKRTKETKYEECADTFKLYNKSNGEVQLGLINRRKDEEALYRRDGFPTVEKPNERPDEAILTATGERYESGRWADMLQLNLRIGDTDFSVCSGQPYAQVLRKPQDPRSVPGNAEPIPQGRYEIDNISWAGGKDNYEASHGTGLGPVWVGLTATFSDDRSAFGIHGDYGVVGTMGCIGVAIADLPKVVEALRKFDPKILVVDWNL